MNIFKRNEGIAEWIYNFISKITLRWENKYFGSWGFIIAQLSICLASVISRKVRDRNYAMKQLCCHHHVFTWFGCFDLTNKNAKYDVTKKKSKTATFTLFQEESIPEREVYEEFIKKKALSQADFDKKKRNGGEKRL